MTEPEHGRTPHAPAENVPPQGFPPPPPPRKSGMSPLPDGAAGKLTESALGPELRPQPLPAGEWEEGTIGVRVQEDGTTVESAMVARHTNLFANITWSWASGVADLSASRQTVQATATSVFAVA